jgi:integrase
MTKAQLLSLQFADIRANGTELRVRSSNGKKARIIPLSRLARTALKAAIAQNPSATGRIFKAKSITSANTSQSFMRACRAAHLDASFRDLRHTFASLFASLPRMSRNCGPREYNCRVQEIEMKIPDHLSQSLRNPARYPQSCGLRD